MKKSVTIAILTGIFTAFTVICTVNNTEQLISDGVIRLHVIAHNDTQEEQALKLKVRDRILKEGKKIYGEETQKENIRSLTAANLQRFKRVAMEEVTKNGYNHEVKVSFGKSEFPSRVYGDMCLPAGTYEALLVEIGSAEGHNWWCVMFPPLCFVNETCEDVSPETKNLMIETIGEDACEMISGKKPKIKFKIYEWWKKVSG